MKYDHTSRQYRGKIVELTSGTVTIEIKGRLGQLKLPKRLMLNDETLEIGQEVGFMLSYPEVMKEEKK